MWTCKECGGSEFFQEIIDGTASITRISKSGLVSGHEIEECEFRNFLCYGCDSSGCTIQDIAEWVGNG